MAVPDFICIGAQKAGTTWLDNMLRSHNRIWTPLIKEVQYFNQKYMSDSFEWTQQHREVRTDNILRHISQDANDIDWHKVKLLLHLREPNISEQWYEGIFDFAPSYKIKGDITPEYCLLEEKHVEDIHIRYPDLKIIFLMREPISRALSHIRMGLTRSGFNSDSKQNEIDKFVLERAIQENIILRGNYERICSIWEQFYSRQQILYLISDDLYYKPNQALTRIAEFLEIDPNGFDANVEHKVFVGKKYKISQQAIDKVEFFQKANSRWYEQNSHRFRI